MSFNPLGDFRPGAPVDAAVLAAAKIFRVELTSKYPCPAGSLSRIYGHWTVGHYGQDFPDYNGAVRYANGHFAFDVCGNPQDNAVGVNNNAEHAHTYMRNSGAFGIATDDMVFAGVNDFGPEPLTLAAVEWLCAGIAAVAAAYDIDLAGTSTSGTYAGEPVFLTHAEAADRVGNPAQYAAYGPGATCERWDFATLVPAPQGESVSAASALTCGNALRARAHFYKVALLQ